jgi:hypothetical protein
MEHLSSSVLRRESDPSDDSMVVVNHVMSAERDMRHDNFGANSTSTRDGSDSTTVTFGPEIPEPTAPPEINLPMPELPVPVSETALVVFTNQPAIELQAGEDDPDHQNEDDDRAPMGSGFIYDDETLKELMNDLLGARRDETNRRKNSLIGNSTLLLRPG